MAKKKKFRLTRSTRNQLLNALTRGDWREFGQVKPTITQPVITELPAAYPGRPASLAAQPRSIGHQPYLNELKKIGLVIGLIVILLVALKIADQLTGVAQTIGRRLTQTIGITSNP